MNKTLATVLAVGLMALVALPALADDYTGYVVDAKCTVGMGAKAADPGHAACAKSCIKTGAPVALEGADGKLWLLAPSGSPKNLTSWRDQMANWAGKKVTVTGTIKEQGGLKILFVDKVSAAK
ncbi:MAG TPA: hypothetical protein VNO81_08725 [Candidatus Nitrosotenuis sp.]|jgi:hypothetical protein|nr:hypothetical protein [Candidatus Nitrosotenuis sp.]